MYYPLKNKKANLSRLEKDQLRQQKSRQIKRAKAEAAVEKNPNLADVLGVKKPSCRLRIESQQSDLLETIVSIVSLGSAAHLRRREDVLRNCVSLDDLHAQLLTMGYSISRSATYLRLILRQCNTKEGKRHVKTVPVKLIKAQTSEHKSHMDKNFCIAIITALNTLASFLWPE